MTLPWIAIVVLALAALFYGGVPLLIKATLKLRGRPTYALIAIDQMPPEVYDHMGRTAVGLQRCGFEIRAYVHIPDQVPNAQAYIGLWVNPAAAQMATAVVVFGTAPNIPTQVKSYVEYMTLAGGAAVLTNNSLDIGSFKRLPDRHVLWCIPTENPAEIYRVHLHRESQYLRPDAPRYIPRPGEELDALKEGSLDTLRRQARAGYLVEDPDQMAVFRPSWTGAYLMTWCELPPIRNIRLQRWRRWGAQALQHAQAHPLDPPRSVRITHQSPYGQNV